MNGDGLFIFKDGSQYYYNTDIQDNFIKIKWKGKDFYNNLMELSLFFKSDIKANFLIIKKMDKVFKYIQIVNNSKLSSIII